MPLHLPRAPSGAPSPTAPPPGQAGGSIYLIYYPHALRVSIRSFILCLSSAPVPRRTVSSVFIDPSARSLSCRVRVHLTLPPDGARARACVRIELTVPSPGRALTSFLVAQTSRPQARAIQPQAVIRGAKRSNPLSWLSLSPFRPLVVLVVAVGRVAAEVVPHRMAARSHETVEKMSIGRKRGCVCYNVGDDEDDDEAATRRDARRSKILRYHTWRDNPP